MLKPKNVLHELARPAGISIESNTQKVGSVERAAAKDDEKRAKKQAEEDAENKTSKLRRKPNLQPLATGYDRFIELPPWAVLHSLARAITLAKQGAARGLAEHWGALKYSQALTGTAHSAMQLSEEGKEIAKYYKTLQSGELGTGFALATAERYLAHLYPDRSVSIVPADTALLAGWTYRGWYHPDFFAEVWKPGEPSLVFPIVCKGNHSDTSQSHAQLASASAHVETVHIGPGNETPALIFSTQLPRDGSIAVHALCAGGTGGRIGAHSGAVDRETDQQHYFPTITVPANDDEPATTVSGFHITPKRYEWFGRVLARTAAAGVTAFAGADSVTKQYLTARQGQRRFTGFAHSATGSVQDTDAELHGVSFAGTDHVFRLDKTRFEAFSGVETSLLDLLSAGKVEQYRRLVHERRSSWPTRWWDRDWGGPVSIRPDGTALAIRRLR